MSAGYLNTEIVKGSSIDVFDRTQGTPGLIVVKSSNASNCVVPVAVAQSALGTANFFNNPFPLLGICANAAATDGVSVNLKGKELPNSPHWTASFGAQYTMELGSGWTATLRGDYYKQTKTFSRIYNSNADEINGWDNINATLTVNSDNGLTVEAFVKNAADKKSVTDIYLTDDSSGLYRNAFYTEPRTYGFAVSKKW
jgi:outer membrane receptor protein involved in Fe transport